MGSLEITMTIKCGECITHDNYSFKRSETGQFLELAETINTKGFGHFTAKQYCPDVIKVTCNECGHVDKISI